MRIRRRTETIPAGAAIVDLDDVVIDHRAFYRAEFARRGYRLSPAELNANLVKQHVPAEVLGEVEAAALGDGTRRAPAFPGALEVLERFRDSIYLTAARGPEQRRPALSWLADNLPVFSERHVVFFPTVAAKCKELKGYELSVLVDDQIGPVKSVADSVVRLLFDPDGALDPTRFPGIEVVRDWAAIRRAVESTVKPLL